MKKIFTLIGIVILFLSACTNNSHNGKASGALNSREIKQIIKNFSDTVKSDTFRVELAGNKDKDLELAFSIIAFDGNKIYEKRLKASDLLRNYENLGIKKDEAKLKFMQEELNLFLDDENFLEPAITESEQPDQNAPDKGFYVELKKSGLNGFKYRLGKESQIYIAWSEREHKVKVYYKCC